MISLGLGLPRDPFALAAAVSLGLQMRCIQLSMRGAASVSHRFPSFRGASVEQLVEFALIPFILALFLEAVRIGNVLLKAGVH